MSMKITVYGASSGQIPEKYTAAAAELGRVMAQRGHTLINGAGRTGMMGATTDALLAEGGEAIGIIPQFMIEQGWQHTGMTELIITPDMHSRKEKMAAMNDACIACPGGVGTLEELFEIITWKQLGLYLKPIVILNTDGYFDAILAQLQRCVEESFMRQQHLACWCVASTPEEAVRLCETTPLWDVNVRRFAAL